ncbi:MAG: hypothetical protein IJ087_05530 [Eggerthellaceae bacterium]|nr:hypothetical protein [Eggerthellaceae bacterium]
MVGKSAYGASAREIAELFAAYLEGGSNRPAIALSSTELDGYSKNAIEKSLEAFGYTPDSCTFATTSELDAQAIFLLIEGLDPLYVISTDGNATAKLAQAYRLNLPDDQPARILGRPAVTFADLHSLMATPESKQKAWKLLKSLPH